MTTPADEEISNILEQAIRIVGLKNLDIATPTQCIFLLDERENLLTEEIAAAKNACDKLRLLIKKANGTPMGREKQPLLFIQEAQAQQKLLFLATLRANVARVKSEIKKTLQQEWAKIGYNWPDAAAAAANAGDEVALDAEIAAKADDLTLAHEEDAKEVPAPAAQKSSTTKHREASPEPKKKKHHAAG